MKTSKIIFISLLSFMALFILAAFIDVRINGRKTGQILDQVEVSRQPIPSFNVLRVESSYLNIIQNDSSFIEITILKDSVAPIVNYTLKEDTLIITDTKYQHWISVNTSNSLVSIIAKNSNISFQHFTGSHMSLELDSSNIDLVNELSSFRTLGIVAKNHSDVSTGSYRVDSLQIDLQSSNANIQIIAKRINGTLSDSSYMYARQPDELWLKKDSTSNINVSDY